MLTINLIFRYLTRPADAPREQAHIGGFIQPTARLPTPEPVAKTTRQETDSKDLLLDDKEDSEVISQPVREQVSAEVFSKDEKFPELYEAPVSMEVEEPVQIAAVLQKPAPPLVEREAEECPVKEATITYLNDRGDLIYHFDDPLFETQSSKEDVGDDFFELSVDELRKRMRDLQQQYSAMQNAPLTTSEQRQAQKEQRHRELLERYPQTVLRVQFADGLVLQVPLPSETILSRVKEEVVAYLDGNLRPEDLFLYTSPPRVVLEPESSLFALGLSPSSVVYIGTSSESSVQLKAEHQLKVSSYLGAMRDATKRLHVSAQLQSEAGDANQEYLPSSQDKKGATERLAKRPTSTNTVNAPKWFKMNRQ